MIFLLFFRYLLSSSLITLGTKLENEINIWKLAFILYLNYLDILKGFLLVHFLLYYDLSKQINCGNRLVKSRIGNGE